MDIVGVINVIGVMNIICVLNVIGVIDRNPWPIFVQFRCHHSTTTFSPCEFEFPCSHFQKPAVFLQFAIKNRCFSPTNFMLF